MKVLKIRKTLSAITISAMIVNWVLFPASLYAQETQETTPTPTEEVTPTPSEGASMETGDAGSSATSENEVNVTDTQTEGSVDAGGCGADVEISDCPGDITNEAEVEQDTSATSTSGENEATSSASSDITTGDAGAQATSTNTVNETVVEAVVEDTTEEEATDSAEVEENELNLDNDVDLETNTTAESTSGENQNEADETLIDTGDAIALANQFNLLNTNIIGSNFTFVVINIAGEYLGDIDLNALWLALVAALNTPQEGDSNTQTDVNIENNADVDVASQATAVSGSNESEADQAIIYTGDSIAIANLVNIINLNVIGSTFFLPIINIFGTLNGNIIFPSEERFLTGSTQDINGGEIDITNLVYITSQVNSGADSGDNTQEGTDLGLETGDAYAQGSSTNYLNMNILDSNWYQIIINNFGFWLGGANGSTTEVIANGEQTDEDVSGGSNITIFNAANIQALAEAFALSGGNQASGDSSFISTGWAMSLANIFNLVNTNIIGSNFMMPLITIFNTWNGDIVYAYPDLAISLSADKNIVRNSDSVTYNVSFMNNGNDIAKDCTVSAVLPEGESVNGSRVVNLSLGTVQPGAGGSFSFQTSFNKPNDSTTEYTTLAYITSSDPESDDSNNSSSATKTLENGGGPSDQLPTLELNSSTNIGEFVYAGDVVTFEVNLKNAGAGVSKNTQVYQSVYDQAGYEVAFNQFKLADIGENGSRRLSFGLRIPDQAPSGTYYSVISADGQADNGTAVTSNASENPLLVKGKYFAFGGEVQAAEPEVKGAFAKKGVAPKADQAGNFNYWLGILAALLLAAWLTDLNRERLLLLLSRRKKEEEEEPEIPNLIPPHF